MAGDDETVAAKARIRAESLARRDGLPADIRAAASAAIAGHILGLELAAGAAVSGFLPIRSEVDLTQALTGLSARGHGIGLPVVTPAHLVFRQWRPGDDLVPLGFGTRGPGPSAPELLPDVMLVPLSAFDRRGGRIGYGRAHYDRTIAAYHAAGRFPRLIGVAFSVQEVAHVPMEAHDMPLDLILTEGEAVVIRPLQD